MRRLHRKTAAKQSLKPNHVVKKFMTLTIPKTIKKTISPAMTTAVRSV